GVILYFGVSLGALFVAVLTAPHPSIAEEEWILGDWIVLGVGGGLTIAFLIREFWLPKKKMLRESAPEGTGGSKHIKKLRPGKKRVILESSA
ncbi:MAG: hypothetical protein ACE5EQ_12740, partial [Phycisphaerae bacterium]